MAKVLILLATYNGSKFIRTMVDSVIAQDYKQWHLVLSDDGSTDNTIEILEEYAKNRPNQIIHYRSGKRFGCAQKHFMHLLQQFHDAEYIMFCDQDDFWHSDKIRKTLNMMKQIEIDSAVPTLVHTDLRVVDGQLRQIAPSFCKYSKLDGNRVELKQLLIQNVVTGCTMMINRSLAELGCKSTESDQMLMHDWWLALLAASCGKIGFLDEATIDYRQHGNNSVGAKNIYSVGHIVHQLTSSQISKNIMGTFINAEAFLTCYEDSMPQEKAQIVRNYIALKNKNGFARRAGYIRYGFWKIGLFRKVGQLLMG